MIMVGRALVLGYIGVRTSPPVGPVGRRTSVVGAVGSYIQYLNVPEKNKPSTYTCCAAHGCARAPSCTPSMFNGIQGIVVLPGFQKRVNQFALTLVYVLLNCDYCCTKCVRTRYIYV